MGTVCNRATGYCEERACGGKCGEHESCQMTAAGEECVPNDFGTAYRGDGPADSENVRGPLDSQLELCE